MQKISARSLWVVIVACAIELSAGFPWRYLERQVYIVAVSSALFQIIRDSPYQYQVIGKDLIPHEAEPWMRIANTMPAHRVQDILSICQNSSLLD